MQATVNLRVLDANTFLRDSLIGSYQFDLLGIYVEKVCMCIWLAGRLCVPGGRIWADINLSGIHFIE